MRRSCLPRSRNSCGSHNAWSLPLSVSLPATAIEATVISAARVGAVPRTLAATCPLPSHVRSKPSSPSQLANHDTRFLSLNGISSSKLIRFRTILCLYVPSLATFTSIPPPLPFAASISPRDRANPVVFESRPLSTFVPLLLAAHRRLLPSVASGPLSARATDVKGTHGFASSFKEKGQEDRRSDRKIEREADQLPRKNVQT